MTAEEKELVRLSASELSRAIRSREISAAEAVDAYLARIERLNPTLNAYVEIVGEEARARAREEDAKLDGQGEAGPLAGVPVAIKDLDARRGTRLTFGSVPFRDHVADDSAVFVDRLEQAGAIVLGKTNTPEFGHSATTDNLLFGPTSTPFDTSKNSGGSSGGSAAAVMGGLAALSQGSDGGGSIRIPASCCGALGYMPSWGRIPLKLRPNAFLHTPRVNSGPITRTVADTALMLQVMAGPHAADPFCLPADESLRAPVAPLEPRGVRIAYSPTFGGFPVEPAVRDVIAEAVRALEASGASVDELEPDWGHTPQTLVELWLEAAAVLNAALVESYLEEGIDLMGAHSDELTTGFRESVELGRTLSALRYRMADVARTTVFDRLEQLLATYDFIVTPTTGVAAVDNSAEGFTFGPEKVDGVEVDRVLGWVLTYPVNFTGHPGASVPAGLTADGLPVGLQVVGRRFADRAQLGMCAALEEILPWAHRYERLLDQLG